jgi:hypothetical protein
VTKRSKETISQLMAEWGRKGGKASRGGGAKPTCHPDAPDPNCPRCKKRLAIRAYRARKKASPAQRRDV